MTIEQIIKLCESIEQGKEGQVVGLHLHKPLMKACDDDWFTSQSYSGTFSGFLTALKDHEEVKC